MAGHSASVEKGAVSFKAPLALADSVVISRFRQADSVVFSRFPEKEVVEKTYKSKSKGLQRTLSIYGFLQELNLEHAAPLPKLLSVETVGQSTKLIQEYVGPDYCQHRPVEEDKFWELHETSATELRNLGLMDRISRHKQNWAVRREGMSFSYRAILLDIGHCSLTPLSLKQTLERRVKL